MEQNGVLNSIYLQNQRKIKEYISSMNGYKYYIVGIDIVSSKGYRFSSGHIVQNYDELSRMIAETNDQVLSQSMVMMSPLHVDSTWLCLSSDFVVPSVRAILDVNRRIVGYAVLYFDYSVIEQMFTDNLPLGSLFQVQNDRQEMIFTNCGDTPMQLYETGKDYVYSTYSAPAAGWTLHMMIPSAAYTQEIEQSLYCSLALTLAVFVLTFGVATAISRQISGEIAGFRNAMHRLGQGDLDVRYQVSTRDEIAVMASTFNHMVARLKKLMNEVAAYERQKQEMQLKLLQAQIRALLTEGGRTEVSVSSIGVPNVVQRIRMYCTDPYGLQYTSEPGCYTRATFTLPILHQAEAPESAALQQERMSHDEQDSNRNRG